jgi:serine/threonine-protein phosphatase 6 regulatory subunit 3
VLNLLFARDFLGRGPGI